MKPHEGLTDCRLCPRLVDWREHIADVKRASFADETYWGRPVPALGPLDASVLIVGLAPAAHGANRTGRMFCGDNSGRWLFRALHKVGLVDRELGDDPPWPNATGCRITAVVHCAPPDNKPTTIETNTCRDTWLVPEIKAMPNLGVVVALGGLAWANVARVGTEVGWSIPRPRPSFGGTISIG
ncbi:MAG: uracil-DNA glycosylase, partial [Acidimicrobiia bacterium]|nr:uracil-DNA glycosylase [Acidimicrobiia bacterium]